MAVPFSIRDEVDGGVVRMVVGGEIDLKVVSEFRAHVSGLLGEPSVQDVVVDLSAVGFLDSSGIGEFVRCKRLAADVGKSFRVVAGRGRVAQVLDLSGMTEFLAD